ncbi:hypothetical protein TNCV_4859331 [Trichonephila clavipes]|nr:hypothetical protein TNCV_4859331 [Trichonephila clavipes]
MKAKGRLLPMDLVILNQGQVTMMTPELLPPPNVDIPRTVGLCVCEPRRFKVHHILYMAIFSSTRFQNHDSTTWVRDHEHSTTLVTA